MTTTTTGTATRTPLAARIRSALNTLAETADPQLLEALATAVTELQSDVAYLTHERDTAQARIDRLLLDMVAADVAAFACEGLLSDVERLSERLARQGSER
ncbi:hypothetical protein ABZ769_35460 [Streptomyces olivoreticuli]